MAAEPEPMQSAETASPADRRHPFGWTLAFLTLIATFNYLDRSLLGLLLPLIKHDLELSDTALGLIAGLAFGLVYTLFSLPIASLADRSNRRNIIAIGFAIWSLMTALSGYVVNGVQMALCRLFMGAGEAAGLAPSQSMIADGVKEEQRPLALAIFSTAAAIDALVLLPASAWIATQYGWRTAFQVAGYAGIVLAILFFITVRETPRALPDALTEPDRPTLFAAFRILWRSRVFRAILAGGAFMGGALYATATWMAALLTRVHGLSVMEVGLYVTPLRGVLGIVGIVGAGWVAQRLGRRDPRWRYWTPAMIAGTLALAYPLLVLSDVTFVWMTGLVITALFYSAYQGPVFDATIALAPRNMRATAVAIKVFISGLVGQIVGPLTVGVLNDLLSPYYGDHAIRYSMLAVALCCAIGGAFFYWAGRLAAHASRDVQGEPGGLICA
jgi:MFS family permease